MRLSENKLAVCYLLAILVVVVWAGITRMRIREIADTTLESVVNSLGQEYSPDVYPRDRIYLGFQQSDCAFYLRWLPHWGVQYRFPDESGHEYATVFVPIFALNKATSTSLTSLPFLSTE